jgi:hypothetical protein
VNGIGLFHHLARIAQDFFTNRRNRDAATGALKNSDAELFLEFPDLATQGWLTDEAALRSLAEVARIGNGDDVLQVTQIHFFDHRIQRSKEYIQMVLNINADVL